MQEGIQSHRLALQDSLVRSSDIMRAQQVVAVLFVVDNSRLRCVLLQVERSDKDVLCEGIFLKECNRV